MLIKSTAIAKVKEKTVRIRITLTKKEKKAILFNIVKIILYFIYLFFKSINIRYYVNN